MKKNALFAVLPLVVSISACKTNQGTVADKVYKNAKVYSVLLDGSEVHAEAVAIKDGKFLYVGNNKKVIVIHVIDGLFD